MSACIFWQLIKNRCNRVPFHPVIQVLCQRSIHTKCTCAQSRNQSYKYKQYQQYIQTRQFSTTNIHRAVDKVTKSFDEYYSAVLEAHKSNENLILYKYREISKDESEREIQLRRWMFNEAVDIYIEKSDSPHASALRRGHVEFISQALQRMRELGVHRELACYKALIKVFPTDIMVPRTAMQVEFYHYPKQQDSAHEILEQMEDNGLMPDQETRDLMEARFGKHTHVVRKIRRMMYWFRKFQNTNPFKLPHYLPLDPIELAILALKKMSVDLENEIKVFKVTDQGQQLFIASAQSPTQRDMIRKHSESVPLYVEGGYLVWLRDKWQTYFILRSDSDSKLFQYRTKEEEDEDFEIETIFDTEEPKQLAPRPSVHQQEDGTILGMCITETSTKDSLVSWIRCLQEANPNLEKIPIVFTLRSPEEGIVPVEDEDIKTEQLEPSK
ncbi:evolutionarily conserved signaling intermediate in Toll pathway, mitochondrial-like [Mercenaria mercenaria]|uniref:evolutionarily conserved signaling intermediate in Toll pathway, mitochondrial-like n=1 Tax=Mercenaria mercenaria TaxID=6596 RepID=UPI001E1D779F|nr:evolutionarily conserved signaling intermediate in Toll pathway, mitochondrial-like [Mercenaria mercenaria]XP_045214181.1 evolutionarily conserved signaling intermediate in Toll pathway, mitochondrial-like [Mercenaria mercenaria]